MGFVGNLFSGQKGAGFQAGQAPVSQVYNNDQINQAHYAATDALGQQQQFLNALQGQNGLGKQGNIYGQMQGTANQLQGIANGTGPNPARSMLNQATGQNVANQAALMAGQRGAGANVGLMARQAAQQGAATQQQAVGQGATIQANQSLAALGALQGQQANMGNLATQMVGQQANGISNYNQDSQNLYNSLLNAAASYNNANVGMQSNINNSNASIAGINAQGQQQMFGGFMNGIAGGLASMMAKGGMVRHYDDGGWVTDDPATGGGTVNIQNTGGPAMMGHAGYDTGKSIQKLATMAFAANGGEVQTPDSPDAPKSRTGQFLTQVQVSSPSIGGSPNIPSLGAFPTSSKGPGSGMMGGMAGGMNPSQMGKTADAFNKMPDTMNKMMGMFKGPAGGSGGTPSVPVAGGGAGSSPIGAPMQMTGSNAVSGAGDVPMTGGDLGDMGGAMALAFHGGAINGERYANTKKKVPGKAEVKGDSLKNDKVPAMLSPGEIIVPRSHASDPDKAAAFVRAVIAKNRKH